MIKRQIQSWSPKMGQKDVRAPIEKMKCKWIKCHTCHTCHDPFCPPKSPKSTLSRLASGARKCLRDGLAILGSKNLIAIGVRCS